MMGSVDMRERFLRNHARIYTLGARLITLFERPSSPDVDSQATRVRRPRASLCSTSRSVAPDLREAGTRSSPDRATVFETSIADPINLFDESTSVIEACQAARAPSDCPMGSPIRKTSTARALGASVL